MKNSAGINFRDSTFSGVKKEFIFANLAKICEIHGNFFPRKFIPLRLVQTDIPLYDNRIVKGEKCTSTTKNRETGKGLKVWPDGLGRLGGNQG